MPTTIMVNKMFSKT